MTDKWEHAGMIRTAVPMQVVASCLMSLQPVLAAEPSIPANTYALISGVIGMAGSLADNADRQSAAMGTGGGDPWLWDLTHNLAPPLPGSRAPRSQHFPSAEQVLCVRMHTHTHTHKFPPPLAPPRAHLYHPVCRPPSLNTLQEIQRALLLLQQIVRKLAGCVCSCRPSAGSPCCQALGRREGWASLDMDG